MLARRAGGAQSKWFELEEVNGAADLSELRRKTGKSRLVVVHSIGPGDLRAQARAGARRRQHADLVAVGQPQHRRRGQAPGQHQGQQLELLLSAAGEAAVVLKLQAIVERREPGDALARVDKPRPITMSKRLRELDLPMLKEDAANAEEVRARRERHLARISDDYIEALVDSVTAGFRGDVGVVPRQFLRKFVNSMDILREHEDYDPPTVLRESGYQPSELAPEERATIEGQSMPAEGDELVPVEDAW